MVCRCGNENSSELIAAVFSECIGGSEETISFVFGWISIGFWVFAIFPQIRMLFLQKESEGLSPVFLVSWLMGDLLTGVSAFVLRSLLTERLLCAFWMTADAILISMTAFYHFHPGKGGDVRIGKYEALVYVFMAIILASNVAWFCMNRYTQLQLAPTEFPFCAEQAAVTPGSSSYIIGTVMAYAAIPCYLTSSPSQVVKNRKAKSVQGISWVMFLCTFSGSLFEFLSIVTFSHEKSYLLEKMPYLISELIPTVCDLVVLLEFLKYAEKKQDYEKIEIA